MFFEKAALFYRKLLSKFNLCIEGVVYTTQMLNIHAEMDMDFESSFNMTQEDQLTT